jgi:PD-(D/E)XK nuclease superfamily
MARPKGWEPYRLADGTEVPSVTTVLNRFKESGGLIHWAWAEGKAGRDYRASRDAAASSGTIAHAMVEAEIRRKSWRAPEDAEPDVLRRATQAFANYQEWRRQTNLQPVETEKRLVSEKHRFGGTLDAMLVSGRLSLGDFKTSNSIYQDYLLQLAAYGLLWEENYPDRPIEGGFHLLRFAKDTPDFAHYHFG